MTYNVKAGDTIIGSSGGDMRFAGDILKAIHPSPDERYTAGEDTGSMERPGLMQILAIMFDNAQLEDNKVVKLLVSAGLPEEQAEIAVALIPSALGRAILEKMGVVGFSVLAKTEDGAWVEIDLERQPIYQEVLALARHRGWLGNLNFEGYQTIVSCTSELNSANKALQAGDDLNGARISTTIPNVSAEQFGYEP